MLAVFFVFFGATGIKIFVALIAFGIFPTLAQSITQAAQKDVDEHRLYRSYTLGASDFEVVWEFVLRQILPRIIENSRMQIGPAMVFLIAAEFALADRRPVWDQGSRQVTEGVSRCPTGEMLPERSEVRFLPRQLNNTGLRC